MTHYVNLTISWLLLAVYVWIVVSCVIVILSENRNPIRSLTWVIALIFLPFVGIVFYLFFGRSPKMTQMSRQHRRRILSSVQPPKIDLDSFPLSAEQRKLVKLAAATSHSPLTVHNEIEIFTDGRSKFDALKRDLLNARHFILLQYYIFEDDNLGNEIADILKKKAEQGVTVKVIYDHVGSFKTRNKFFKEMRRRGVDAHPFFRVTFPQLANRINWRNHRKIVVIDGRIGYLGGMNIADRYVVGTEKQIWRDTHFRIQGEAVKSLLLSFALDWNFMNQPLETTDPAQEPLPDVSPGNELGIQLVTSGPTDEWNSLALCFQSAIACARKRIYIQTPYFLPTDALLQALKTASLSGVEVRLMIPRRPDSKMIKFASFSYVTQCLQAGIKVYLYEAGMLHSKNMIIDEDIVTSGSTNFDFRSFENNFESNMLIYNRAANEAMSRIFFEDLRHCRRVKASEWKHRPLKQRFCESIVRLVAPVL